MDKPLDSMELLVPVVVVGRGRYFFGVGHVRVSFYPKAGCICCLSARIRS